MKIFADVQCLFRLWFSQNRRCMAFLWLKAFSQRKKGKTFTNLCSLCCSKSSRRQSIGKDVVGFKFVCEKMCSGCCFPEDDFFHSWLIVQKRHGNRELRLLLLMFFLGNIVENSENLPDLLAKKITTNKAFPVILRIIAFSFKTRITYTTWKVAIATPMSLGLSPY